MITDQDRLTALETSHDLHACKDVAAITSNPAQQAALTDSLLRFGASRESFMAVLRHRAKETSETERATANLGEKKDAVVDMYRFVYNNLEGALTNIDPRLGLSSAEILRRSKVFERVSGPSPSLLSKMDAKEIATVVQSFISGVQADKGLAALEIVDPLVEPLAAYDAAEKLKSAEDGDDKVATALLEAARKDIARHARATALRVEAALVDEGREAELGRYILAANATYKARRRAKVPPAEEPGMETVDAEITTAPTDTAPAAQA